MSAIKRYLLSKGASLFSRMASSRSFQTRLFNAARLDRPEVSGLLRDECASFLSYCLARRSWSRSQILQDLWVCFELGEITGGYFVEFGATNGLKNSNTWLLETKLGWSGVLAEPNPVWHRDLAANRRAFVEHKCVFARSNETVSFVTTDKSDPELSAIAEYSESDHFAATRKEAERISVETISLDDLLDKYAAPDVIDYLSIDTEGSELNILSAHSFRRKFRLISVEINPKTEGPLTEILTARGYERVFARFSQWDAWFVNKDVERPVRRRIFAPDA